MSKQDPTAALRTITPKDSHEAHSLKGAHPLAGWIAVCFASFYLPNIAHAETKDWFDSPHPGTRFDEPIVLEESANVVATKTATDEYTFDFSETPLVTNGAYNDFLITYTTPSTAEEDLFVWNAITQEWDRFTYAESGGFQVFTEQRHSLLMSGLEARHYLNEEGLLRISYLYPLGVQAKALRIDPNYRFIPARHLDPDNVPTHLGGIAFDGESLFLSTGNGVIAIDPETLQWTLTSISGTIGVLAHDGESLWTVVSKGGGSAQRIFRAFDATGSVQCEFTYLEPAGRIGGLTYALGSLWMSELWDGNDPVGRVLQIDPVVSCAGETRVIVGEAPLSPEYSQGMAWDGSRLLVSGRNVLRAISSDGQTLEASYALQTDRFTGDIAFDGEGVWFVHNGLKVLDNDDRSISRFTFPPSELKGDIDGNGKVDGDDLMELLHDMHEE